MQVRGMGRLATVIPYLYTRTKLLITHLKIYLKETPLSIMIIPTNHIFKDLYLIKDVIMVPKFI